MSRRETTNEGRFTLENSIEVDDIEIMYVVIECIQDYENKTMKQWIAYRRGI
jgi:cytidylate kinase